MTKNGGLDPVVLLMLFGIYFVLKYISAKEFTDLLYGIVLIMYHIRFAILKKKSMK